MQARQWTADIFLSEEGDETKARAVLHGDSVNEVVGTGFARRNPHDPSVPEIGDEVAASRALGDLAERLLRVAFTDIDATMPEDSRVD